MIIGLLIGAMLMMWMFPGLPLTRSLHEHLVEIPVRSMSRLKRHHLLYAVILTLLMFSFREVVVIFGSAEVVMAYAFDLALYVDAMIAMSAAAAASYVRGAAQTLRRRLIAPIASVVPLRRPRARARRSETANAHSQPANEDDDRTECASLAA